MPETCKISGRLIQYGWFNHHTVSPYADGSRLFPRQREGAVFYLSLRSASFLSTVNTLTAPIAIKTSTLAAAIVGSIRNDHENRVSLLQEDIKS